MRHLVELIRLRLRAGSDCPSRAIAWWGNGFHGFSHVDLLLPSGELLGARSDLITHKGVVYPAGVQIRPWDYEPDIRSAIVIFKSTRAQAAIWEAWARSKIGADYDRRNIVDLITGRRPKLNTGRFICSAFGTDSLQLPLLELLPPLPVPPQQVTPDSLFIACVAAGARYLEFGPSA